MKIYFYQVHYLRIPNGDTDSLELPDTSVIVEERMMHDSEGPLVQVLVRVEQ